MEQILLSNPCARFCGSLISSVNIGQTLLTSVQFPLKFSGGVRHDGTTFNSIGGVRRFHYHLGDEGEIDHFSRRFPLVGEGVVGLAGKATCSNKVPHLSVTKSSGKSR